MSDTEPRLHSKAAEFARILRDYLPELREPYGVESLGIFGSYVREEERVDSDVDLLVEVSRGIGLFEFAALKDHLTGLLGTKVGLVMKRSLRRRIGSGILEEVVPV